MRGGGFEQRSLFIKGHDKPWLSAFFHKGHAAQRVCDKEPFIDGPKEQVPQEFYVAIYGGVRNRLLCVTVLAVFPDGCLVDPPDFGVPEIRQEHLQADGFPRFVFTSTSRTNMARTPLWE